MDLVNLPEVVAEVAAVLERYEDALVNNRTDVLDELFWNDARTVRLGAGENLYGIEAIRQFRLDRPTAGLARRVVRTEITTFGTDFAVTHREFTREGSPRPGRQTQTLVRSSRGWRIVSAHVSTLG